MKRGTKALMKGLATRRQKHFRLGLNRSESAGRLKIMRSGTSKYTRDLLKDKHYR